MLKTILSALVLTLTLGCAATFSPPTLEDKAWNDACNLSRYSCFGVKRPDVMVSVMAKKMSALGFYVPGTATVYLSPDIDLNEVEGYAVLTHEYVHYLQDIQGDFNRSAGKLSTCLIEEEAFQVYDRVVEKYGRPDLKRPTWYLGYAC